jgi:hypothetical protein
MRRIFLGFLLILALPVCAQTYVHSAVGTSFPLTVTSTTSGNSVFVTISATTQPTAVTLGSQSMSKNSTCGSFSTYDVCLWSVASATGSQTSVTVTGGSGIFAGYEYEISGTNTSSLIDKTTSATGSTTVAVSVTPSISSEVVLAAYICSNAASSVTGSPTASSNSLFDANGGADSLAFVTSTAAQTMTVNSGCGGGTASTAAGAAWSIEGLATVAAPTFSLAAGIYNSSLPRSTTAATSTSGAYLCVTTCTTSGCTPTTPAASTPGTCSTGTQYSTNSQSLTLPVGYQNISILGTESTYINSSVVTSGQYQIVPTWAALNGNNVGITTGYTGKWNGITIGNTAGNIAGWNGFTSPSNQITFDTQCAGDNGGTPATCTMSPTAGDAVACTAAQRSFGTVGGAITDSANDFIYAVTQGTFNSSTGYWQTVWIGFNLAGGSTTFSFTATGSTSGATIQCSAFKGAATSNALDPGLVTQFNPTNGTGVTSTNPVAGSSTQTPTNADELIYGGMSNLSVTPTAGSGFTLSTASGRQTVETWGEYLVQTTATATYCPFTAASDTWIDSCLGLMNAGVATGGVTPLTGLYCNFAGQTATTAVTSANWAAGCYGSVYQTAWAANSITTFAYETPGSLPNLNLSPFVNGGSRSASTGISVTKSGTTQTENVTWQELAGINPNLFGYWQYLASYSGTYAFTTAGNECDQNKFAANTNGDTLTVQVLDEGSGNMGFDVEVSGSSVIRSKGLQVPSTTAWYMIQVENNANMQIAAVTAAANASGGNTVYTCSSGCNVFTANQWVNMCMMNWNSLPSTGTPTYANAFSNHANCGVFQVVGTPTSTSLTLNNPSGVAQTGASANVYSSHHMVVSQVTAGSPPTITKIGDDYPGNGGGSAPTAGSGYWVGTIGAGGSCGTTGLVDHFAYISINDVDNHANFPPSF